MLPAVGFAATAEAPITDGSRNLSGFSEKGVRSHAVKKSGECKQQKRSKGKCKGGATAAPARSAAGSSSGDSATVQGQVDKLDRGSR